MALNGNEDPVGIVRIDRDLSDLLPVAKPFEMRPRFAGVGGLVDTIACGKIRPLQSLAATDVHHVGIAERNRDRADGAAGFAVPDAVPG